MKRFLIAIALTCVLSVSAFAGDIPMTVTATATPPPPEETAMPGDIPSTGSTSLGDMPNVDLSILLTLLDLAF